MNKFNRWIRSKQGATLFLGLVAVALVIALLLQQGDLFGAGGKKKKTSEATPTATSTVTEEANLPGLLPEEPVTFDDPVGGYSCLPTCVENDGKFLVAVGKDVYSIAGQKQVVWISVPGNQPSYTLGIFDGDSGKGPDGVVKKGASNWDNTLTESTYTLYADPLKDGTGETVLATWRGNTDPMQNNAWFEQSLENIPAALSPSGHYYYRLEITHPSEGAGVNGYKLRSSGYLSMGRFQNSGSPIGFSGLMFGPKDAQIVNDGYQSVSVPGVTKYFGNWDFHFNIPNKTLSLEIWNGDFDRGTITTQDEDTDDLNTTGKPEWANEFVVDERAGGRGLPPDDYTAFPLYVRTPAVKIQFIDPLGMPVYEDLNPSGTEEWERWQMRAGVDDPNDPADYLADEIKAGFYTLHVEGLDVGKLVWIKMDYDICDPEDGCGPPVWKEAFCPRTIGYWKNNVSKVLMEGKTSGVQETPDSIHKALNAVALASPLFRSGLNVAAPVAIENAVALTDAETNAILQKTAGNTMLDRALQQNLATWLNLASGKIGPYAWVTINVPSGEPFEGTMMDALLKSQEIILAGGNLEYAKDIADLINNGQINVDPEANIDGSGAAVCENPSVPKDKQPPKDKDKPKAPKPTDPPIQTPPPPVCSLPNTGLGNGFTILSLNPEGCQGQQNGLLFHGTSTTTLIGSAFSNGCLRAVGTTSVQVSEGDVQYTVENFGNMDLISPSPFQSAGPMPEEAWRVAAPDCSNPDAHNVNANDWKGDVNLDPGLYCITGDLKINNNQKFVGNGVTLYMLDGGVTINGGATVQLTAPWPLDLNISPALPNILFYVNGEGGGAPGVKINGTSDSYFEGVVYAPGSEIEVLGNGQVNAPYRTQFIGWDIRVGGTADVFINYLSSKLPACPPIDPNQQ